MEAEGTGRRLAKAGHCGSTAPPGEDRPETGLESQATACRDQSSGQSQVKIPPALGDHCLGSNGEKTRKVAHGQRGRPLRRLCSLLGRGMKASGDGPHHHTGGPQGPRRKPASLDATPLPPSHPLPHPAHLIYHRALLPTYSQSCWLNYLWGLGR